MKRGEPGPIERLTRDELIDLINGSESVADAIRKLGLSHWSNYKTLQRKCRREGVDITPLRDRGKAYSRSRLEGHGFKSVYTTDQIFVEHSPYKSRYTAKQILIKEGYLVEECAVCDRGPEWMGLPLVLILDHINGVNDDYRIENLRLLCPNCNSQTDTFAGRNKPVFCDGCNSRLKRRTPSGLCRSCCAKRNAKANSRTGKRPPLEDLLADRQTMGREAVGRKYGVSGNAVKKWEIAYGIVDQLPDGRSL